MINLSRDDISWNPFPHAVKEEILDPQFFERLKMELPIEFEGKPFQLNRRNLTNGDPRFDRFLKQAPAWARFFGYINSPAYIRFVQELCADRLAAYNCLVDPGDWHWTGGHETDWQYDAAGRLKRLNRRYFSFLLQRFGFALIQDRALRFLNRGRKNDFLLRFDVAEARNSYVSSVHADNPNRLAVLLIYFNSASEIEAEGGDLILFRHRRQKAYRDYERTPSPENVEPFMNVPLRGNTGVFLINTNNSYHGVSPLRCGSERRKFAYIGVTSRYPRIW